MEMRRLSRQEEKPKGALPLTSVPMRRRSVGIVMCIFSVRFFTQAPTWPDRCVVTVGNGCVSSERFPLNDGAAMLSSEHLLQKLLSMFVEPKRMKPHKWRELS